MSRKFSIALVVTVIATLLVVGVASAAGPDGGNGGPGRGQGGAIGQIIDLGADQITIEKLDGSQAVVLVNENTRFFDQDSETAVSLSDLEVGMWVGGRARQNDDGDYVAFAVVILPADFDPEAVGTGEGRPDGRQPGNQGPGRNGQQAGNRGFGTIQSISGDTVVVETDAGETLTLTATEETRFGQDDSIVGLSDLEVGETVHFGYTEAEDGTLELHGIGAGDADCPQDGSGRPDGQRPVDGEQGGFGGPGNGFSGRGNGTSGTFPIRNGNGG